MNHYQAGQSTETDAHDLDGAVDAGTASHAGTSSQTRQDCTESMKIVFDISDGIDPERAAMLLAISRTREEEEVIKKVLARTKLFKFSVTEIGGMNDALRGKVAPQIVGACVNQAVIDRTPSQVHALMHALLEAERGLCMDAPLSGSLALKIAVVTDGSWVAVAMFGDSAFHVLTNHRRAGLGVMHLAV